MLQNTKIKISSCLLSTLFSFSALAQNQLFKYQWPSVKGAHHYLITIAEPTRQYRIYTRETLLYLKKDEAYQVAAIDSHRKILKYLQMEVSILPFKPELLLVEEKKPVEKRPEPKVTAEPPLVLSPAEKEKRREVLRLLEEERLAFEAPPFRRLLGSIGLGKEDLSVDGGTSSFTGSSPVLLSSAKLEVKTALSRKPLLSSFYLDGGFHNFVSSEKESSGASSPEASVVSHPRMHLHLAGEFHVLERGAFSAFLESGISFVELPVPKLTAESATDLGSGTALGLLLALSTSYTFQNGLNLRARTYAVPFSFSSYTFSAFSFDFSLRYALIEDLLDAEIRAFSQKEKLSLTLNCQGVVGQCSTLGKVESSLRGLMFGLGLSF